MKIVTRLTESDIIRFNFYVYFRKWITRIIVFFMILDIFISLIFPEVFHMRSRDFPTVPLMFLIFLPGIVYLQAKRSFKSNRRISEQIEYAFSDKNLIVTGESFSTTMTWEKILKVTKTKRWIMIWQNKNIANLIPVKDIWGGDILNLKEILDRSGVRNNL